MKVFVKGMDVDEAVNVFWETENSPALMDSDEEENELPSILAPIPLEGVRSLRTEDCLSFIEGNESGGIVKILLMDSSLSCCPRHVDLCIFRYL